MVKFGKEFRKKQEEKWKENYIDYKSLKKLIKQAITEKPGSEGLIKSEKKKPHSKRTQLVLNTKNFVEVLDKEIKRVYIFFAKEEKKIFKQINIHLHKEEDYPYLEIEEYKTEFTQLKSISLNANELSFFVFLNLKALIKILKKFDKKVVGEQFSKYTIKKEYIQKKLEEINSDLLYMYNFKILDEVIALLEDLTKNLKYYYDMNKSSLKLDKKEQSKEKLNDKKENFIMEEINFSSSSNVNQINENIKIYDKINQQVKKLFLPWGSFFKVNTQLSRLYSITKEVSQSNIRENAEHSYISILDNISLESLNLISSPARIELENLYHKKTGILSNVFFSSENTRNIHITLYHTALYMFTDTMAVPGCVDYVKYVKEKEFLSTIVLSATPIGFLFSFLYSLCWSIKSTKKPMILSCLFLLLGSTCYFLANFEKMKSIGLLIGGRFLIGLGSNRLGNKIYLSSFIPSQKLHKYLMFFRILTIAGGVGGLFVDFLIYSTNKDKEQKVSPFLNERTIPSLICMAIWLIMVLYVILGFTESHSKNFSITDFTLNGNQHGLSQQEVFETLSDNQNPLTGEKSINNSIKKDAIMIDDINSQLEKFNSENQYSDTNIVSKYIWDLTHKERKKLYYLFGPFIVLLCILFTTKFIYDLYLCFTPLFLISNAKSYTAINLCLIIGGTLISILIMDVIFFKPRQYIGDKILLFIFIPICFVLATLLVKNWFQNEYLEYIILSSLLLVFSSYIEKVTTQYFSKIIPVNYIICKMQGNLVINILAVIGKIMGSLSPSLYGYLKISILRIILFGIVALFYLICFFLILIFKSKIRVKAISRIMREGRKGSGMINI